jgi:drug/metabolite transporter (DMT)-like permease
MQQPHNMDAGEPGAERTAGRRPLLFPILTSAMASVITGTALVATRYVVPQTDGLTIATLRYVVAAACLLPLVPAFYRFNIAFRDLVPIAALGILYFCIFPWCISAAMEYTTASAGSIILTSTPAVTLLLGGLMRSEAWSGSKGLGVAFSIFGAGVAVGITGFEFSDGAWFGNGLMVLATLSGAVYAVFSKPYLVKYPPLTVTAFAMGSGAVALISIWLVQNHASGIPQLDAPGWWAILYIGAAGGALSFFLYAWALGRTTPTVTMILLPLHPIAAILGGALFLGEPLSVWLFVGLALVIIGIIVVVSVENQRSLDVAVRGIGEP